MNSTYCSNCGTANKDGTFFCANCGSALAQSQSQTQSQPQYQQPQYQQPQYGSYNGYQQPYVNQPPQDAPSAGYAVLGFFIPLVGLILYLTCKDTTPLKAKSAGKGALISVIVAFVLGIGIPVFTAIMAILGKSLH